MPNQVPASPFVPCVAANRRHTPRRPRALALLLLAALAALPGCSDRPRLNALDNLAPEVTFDPGRPPDKNPEGATHVVEWSGHDSDGRVDHFRVAINPKTLEDDDPAWVATGERRRTLLAPRRAGLGAAGRDRTEGVVHLSDGRDFDLIAVQAVDDRGALSAPAVRAFFADNIAPTVQITSPRPSALVAIGVPPTLTIRFNGTDPDGVTGEPAYYKYVVLGLSPGVDFPIELALANPDSLRRHFAPDFEGWATASHEAGMGGSVALTGLEPGPRYVFVVVAFDVDGAYSPVFSRSSNMLYMRSTHANVLGPTISVVTDVTSYQTATGGMPGPTVELEYPSGVPLALHWSGIPSFGITGIEYRWVLDSKDLDKEFKRARAGNDLHHWRPWSPYLTSATIGPFNGGETHEFVVEARDEFGRTRLTVRIHTVDRAYEGDLLIVDDTRLVPDELASGTGCVRPPVGLWPTAAELDTFLFARGTMPWRCYPAGTISSPGLFAGYAFDTLGTRTGSSDLTVPLEILNRYRHVIWIVDARSATYNRPSSDPVQPPTALRYMSAPGRVNTLGAYIRGGGKVWLLGGGGAFATMWPWNVPNNDGGGITFSNALGELVPGRFMYDFVHWRSEIQVATTQWSISRHLGRSPLWPGVPDYTRLPAQMRLKTPSLDPFPPGRAGQPGSVYYRSTIDVEFLSQENSIIENGESALDSLYRAVTFALPPTTQSRVCMTYYHGTENAPVVFSGFDVWSFTRADCQALVDFVLQDVWGLPKDGSAEVLVRSLPAEK